VLAVRKHIKKYYEGWTICEDPGPDIFFYLRLVFLFAWAWERTRDLLIYRLFSRHSSAKPQRHLIFFAPCFGDLVHCTYIELINHMRLWEYILLNSINFHQKYWLFLLEIKQFMHTKIVMTLIGLGFLSM
jgi:hypothetical protein